MIIITNIIPSVGDIYHHIFKRGDNYHQRQSKNPLGDNYHQHKMLVITITNIFQDIMLVITITPKMLVKKLDQSLLGDNYHQHCWNKNVGDNYHQHFSRQNVGDNYHPKNVGDNKFKKKLQLKKYVGDNYHQQIALVIAEILKKRWW